MPYAIEIVTGGAPVYAPFDDEQLSVEEMVARIKLLIQVGSYKHARLVLLNDRGEVVDTLWDSSSPS